MKKSQLSGKKKASVGQSLLICGVAICALVVAGASSAIAKPLTIIYAHASVGDNPSKEFAAFFEKKVEELSNGEMQVEVYGEGQLGGEQQLIDSQQQGIVQVSWSAINNLTPRVPRLAFFNLPYLIGSFEEAYRVQDAITEHAQNWMIHQAGIRLIGWEAMGFRAFFNSKRPINTPEDMKGLVWRVPKDDVLISNYESWGVHPQPIAWHELFNALTQGVVNGGGNPLDDIVAAKFYEAAPYITQMHYNLLCHAVSIAEPFYQSLEPDQQKIIDEAGRLATEHVRSWITDYRIPKMLEVLESDPKIKINEPADEEAFAKMVVGNWPKFYKLIGNGDAKIGEQLVTEIKEIADGKRDRLSDNLLFN